MSSSRRALLAALLASAVPGSGRGADPDPGSVTPAEIPPVAAPKVPFAFADFGWVNGTSRQTDFPLDGKVISGIFSIESGFAVEFSDPTDHTVVGSTAVGRSDELQITHLGVGADFHWKNARGRIMTQLGMYSTMTPRNDASPGRGQWTLADAYRYITEGYGGYHFDVDYGLNVDAGIFLSYVGLDSYYNYENWQNQASYVSSNTPWFFNGIRVQWFPNEHLKIEPWLINGWQSYGMFNQMPGLGLQVLYRPTGWLSLTFNNYYGKDTLATPARHRIHTDDSVVMKYYESPASLVTRSAFSLTFDAGCENGGGVSCTGSSAAPAQYFVGFMLYNRIWFARDLFALTLGGGAMTNPGRYLVLVPPINGATAFSGTPYFTFNPGNPFKAWDTTTTFDFLPSQNVTFRVEYVHRRASVPYFAGHGGVTPPGGNTGPPGSAVAGWAPELVNDENRLAASILVRI
jgi:hypothetical protein